jgi:hypothetical protein
MSSSARGQDEKAAALCPRSQVCHCPKIRSHRVRGQRLIRGVLPPSRGTVATDDPVGTEESVCLRHKSSRAPRSCFAARADLDALTLACLRIRGHGRNIWGFAAPACSPSGCFGSEAQGRCDRPAVCPCSAAQGGAGSHLPTGGTNSRTRRLARLAVFSASTLPPPFRQPVLQGLGRLDLLVEGVLLGGGKSEPKGVRVVRSQAGCPLSAARLLGHCAAVGGCRPPPRHSTSRPQAT